MELSFWTDHVHNNMIQTFSSLVERVRLFTELDTPVSMINGCYDMKN